MKVLMIGITYPIIGGAERHIYELYKSLSKTFDLFIITQHNFILRREFGKKVITIPCFKHNVYFRNISFYFLSIFYLIKIILFYNPRIVHIHFGPLQGILGLITRLFNKKLIYTVHGFHGWKMSKNYFVKNLCKFYLNLADLIICVSPAIIEDLKTIGVKRKMMYIPNGINKKFFIKKQNNIKKIILFFGRLHKQKGVEYLLLAFKKLYKKTQEYKLFIIGDGPERKRLIELVGNHPGIFFKGFVDDQELIKYIQSSYMIVLPSIYEGFPIALLEAMASGRPVITTKIKEITSIVDRGVIFVEPKNVDDLEKSIYTLIKKPKFASKIGKEGRKYARKFLWEKISKTYVSIYKELINKK